MDGRGGKMRAWPSRNSGPGAPSGYTLFRFGRRFMLKREFFLKWRALGLLGCWVVVKRSGKAGQRAKLAHLSVLKSVSLKRRT